MKVTLPARRRMTSFSYILFNYIPLRKVIEDRVFQRLYLYKDSKEFPARNHISRQQNHGCHVHVLAHPYRGGVPNVRQLRRRRNSLQSLSAKNSLAVVGCTLGSTSMTSAVVHILSPHYLLSLARNRTFFIKNTEMPFKARMHLM